MKPTVTPSSQAPTGITPDQQAFLYKSLEPKQRLFLLVGPPLSGKSLAGGFVAHTYENLPHRIFSDMIRDHINDELNFVSGPRKLQYESYLRKMNQGILLPDAFVNDFVQKVIENNPKGVVLDGFPRTQAQAKFLLELTKDWKQKPFILELDYQFRDEEELHARLSKRTNDAQKGGRIRLDDTEEIVKVRLDVYEEQTKPIFQEIFTEGSAIRSTKVEFHLSGRETSIVKREVVGKLSGICSSPELGYKLKPKS